MAADADQLVKEILDDVIPAFEAVEAQAAAVMLFLKAKGIASDDELAPYLQQAANTSNIRWLAVRVRLEHLISAAIKTVQAPPDVHHAAENKTPDPKSEQKNAENNVAGKTAQNKSDQPPADAHDMNPQPEKDTAAKPTEEKSTAKEPPPPKTEANSPGSKPGKSYSDTTDSGDPKNRALPAGEIKTKEETKKDAA